MVAFKQTDELVDELISNLRSTKNEFPTLAGETHLASRAEGSIPPVHKRLFRRLLRLLFIWIALSKAQAVAVSSKPTSVRAQFVI